MGSTRCCSRCSSSGRTLPVDVFGLGTPVSNFPVALQIAQRIEATDPLLAGTYSMPLTLTLSTTAP